MIQNYDINMMFMLLCHFSSITAELIHYTGSGTGNGSQLGRWRQRSSVV